MKFATKFLRVLPFAALLVTALASAAEEVTEMPGVPVEKLSAYRDGDTFTAELQVRGAWTQANEVKAQFASDSVQVDFPGTFLAKGKQLIKTDDRLFKSVYATQNGDETVRAKFTTANGVNGHALENLFKVRRTATAIVIEVTGDAAKIDSKKAKAGETSRTLAVIEEENSGDTLPTKLVAGAPLAEAASEIGETAIAAASAEAAKAVVKLDPKAPEDQIPVLATAKEVKKASSNPIGRIMITLGVLATLLAATLYGLKRWSKNAPGKNQNTRIKILTQHAIGPKKSIAIVQVAGESILVGITDHNISMLKTLSLIDDEVPVDVPQRFDHTLDRYEDEEAEVEDFASRDLGKIRDVVSTRLKNMRNL